MWRASCIINLPPASSFQLPNKRSSLVFSSALRALATASFLLRPGVASSTALSAGRVFAVTAELLRDSPGYLVPGSRASLDGRVPERLRARAETLRSWRGPERAWFLLRLLADAGPRR